MLPLPVAAVEEAAEIPTSRFFHNVGPPEVPTPSPGPAFHPEPFLLTVLGPAEGPWRPKMAEKPPVVICFATRESLG